MTRVLLASALAALALPLTAQAQCADPNAVVCAEVEVSASSVSGSIGWGPAQQQVVVQPAPPPPPPPPPRVVVVRPAPPPPPPRVVVRQAPPPPPQTVVVIEQQQEEPQLRVVPARRHRKLSLNARAAGMIGENLRLGGFELGLRFRPSRIFGMELAVGAYGGTDYNDMSRVEIPLMANLMVFLPRETRFQFYLLAGVGTSFAAVDGVHSGYEEYMSRNLRYVGGQLGAGFEWRVAPRFALSMELRGFLRARVDDDGRPEFYDRATGRSTNLSGGGVASIGGHLYF